MPSLKWTRRSRGFWFSIEIIPALGIAVVYDDGEWLLLIGPIVFGIKRSYRDA